MPTHSVSSLSARARLSPKERISTSTGPEEEEMLVPRPTLLKLMTKQLNTPLLFHPFSEIIISSHGGKFFDSCETFYAT